METNGVKDLPDGRSTSLRLELQTEDDKVALPKLNGAAWKGALDLEAYCRREIHLSSQELTKNGGLTAWVLVDGEDKERRILASCETIRKRSLVSMNGKVKDVICHSVGSVFCPPANRGRGYAARLMAELGKRLENWQTDDQPCLFSVLYSDIGKKFYANHGWEPFNSAHISLPFLPALRPDTLPPTRPLYASDLPDLCAIDEALLRQSMLMSQRRPIVANIPTVDTFRWHHAREEFVSNELYGLKPLVKGAVVGDRPHRAWAIWVRFWYNEDRSARAENTLHILRVVLEDNPGLLAWEDAHLSPQTNGVRANHVPAIAALLAAAQREALQWNMDEVEIWNPTTSTLAAARMLHPEATVIQRDEESIASLKWYGDSPSSADGPIAEQIDWIGNEKYGWC